VHLDQEQVHEVKSKVKQEFTESNSKRNREHSSADSTLQLRERAENGKSLGAAWQEGTQDLSSELRDMTRKNQDEEHDCAWKRTAV
jgi:hypothetical protein